MCVAGCYDTPTPNVHSSVSKVPYCNLLLDIVSFPREAAMVSWPISCSQLQFIREQWPGSHQWYWQRALSKHGVPFGPRVGITQNERLFGFLCLLFALAHSGWLCLLRGWWRRAFQPWWITLTASQNNRRLSKANSNKWEVAMIDSIHASTARTVIGSQPASLLWPIKRLIEQTLIPGHFLWQRPGFCFKFRQI